MEFSCSVALLEALADLMTSSSNPKRFASPTGRRGQCCAPAEPLCGVSDKEKQVFALQKMAEEEGFEPSIGLHL
jgi:hypothetical protein